MKSPDACFGLTSASGLPLKSVALERLPPAATRGPPRLSAEEEL